MKATKLCAWASRVVRELERESCLPFYTFKGGYETMQKGEEQEEKI
jgi:hypothetical protein